MKQAWQTTFFLWSSCTCGSIAAQESVEAAAGVAACAEIESALARLDCFDELAREARERDAAGAAAAEPRPTSPDQAPASTVRRPSDAADTARSEEADRVSRREALAAERAEREVRSQVASVREIQPGRIEVTLANGQVWRQTNSDRYNLLVGHEVRLYPSGFGQYFRLSAKELRSFIQVERVR